MFPHIWLESLAARGLRSFGLYWVLAEARYGREVTTARLEELAQVEVQALTGVLATHEGVRMHAVGVETR